MVLHHSQQISLKFHTVPAYVEEIHNKKYCYGFCVTMATKSSFGPYKLEIDIEFVKFDHFRKTNIDFLVKFYCIIRLKCDMPAAPEKLL